ncbi:MAG: beta-propeller domain-containing protein, partial [Oscillospiraceae bacterium]|nr:beta-propeller domain-containing protein [Oscillospiraceae bacterium]
TYSESVYTVTEYRNTSTTQIYRFDLTGGGLELAAAGEVPGYIDSQFSADERDGNLRIVTTRNDSGYKIYQDESYGFQNYKWEEDKSSSGLYVLDPELKVLGSVTGLAEEEYVYSVRFDGDIAYFCTFRSVDPLFTVDLSDPAAPKVLNALKISGFSEYLHRWDEGLLLGFGREADEDTGRAQCLKLVMFDTSDKTDVRPAHTLTLPDVDYSEVLYNHKAFFIVPEQNIIGFLGEDEYYIYSYDPDAGFRQLCRFDFEDSEWRVRGLYIGDWAYIVGSDSLKTVNMHTWSAPAALDISAEED